MTSRRPLIPAVLAASVALAPAAAAQVPPPTLQWDRTCYTEFQPMTYSGTGFSPGGPVDLLYSRPGFLLGSSEATADATGAISAVVMAEAGQLLGEREDRAQIIASASDRTRIEQGADPASQLAASTFTFTRWGGYSPGRLVTGRQTSAAAYGWAFAEGQPVYVLIRKGPKTVASIRLGTLAAPCGDVEKRYTVPRKLRPGAYKLVLSTDATRPGSRYTWRKVRVVRGAASPRRAIARATAGASTRMHRVR
jgi:hypothetical protein